MSRWDDDFDAPRTGPRVVCCTGFSHLGEIAEDDEQPLAALPLVPRARDRDKARAEEKRAQEREATAALQGLLS